jgi:hypothetical protein
VGENLAIMMTVLIEISILQWHYSYYQKLTVTYFAYSLPVSVDEDLGTHRGGIHMFQHKTVVLASSSGGGEGNYQA